MYHFSVLRTPGLIFQNRPEWLLLEIKAYNCAREKPRQLTQVCTTIPTDLSKFDLPYFILNLASVKV